MTKKDILNKIKKTILGEADTTPGITVTNKVKGSDKKFNDEYYKSTSKKFKNYLDTEEDDFDTPKVNTDDELELTYHGSGMEGLSYDNEGTEVEKKFVKRNDDLNKPSKDYYLKKDEVNDVYSKKKKEGESYRKQKKVFQNTPPVRAIQAEKVKSESTIKRLTYKTEFINENVAFNLIPENFKKNDLIFEMTDGNKLMKIRWEGGLNGRPVVLLSKDNQKINKELERMHQLFEYNSRDSFTKTNLLTEKEELDNLVNKFKNINEDEDILIENDIISAIRSAIAIPDEKITRNGSKIIGDLPGVKVIFDEKGFQSSGAWEIIIDPKANVKNVISVLFSIFKQFDKKETQNKIAPMKAALCNYLSSYFNRYTIKEENKEVIGKIINEIREVFGCL